MTVAQERLNSLAIMPIENYFLKNLQFVNVLEEFISKKLHKANVWILIIFTFVKIDAIFL